MANGDDHPFLTARHVDNLTDALRALSGTVKQLEQVAQKQLLATRELSGLLRAAQVTGPVDSSKATPAEGVPARSILGQPTRRKVPR